MDLEEDCMDLQLEVMTARILKQRGSGMYNAAGVTLKVSCSHGYTLNLSKSKVRCRRGEWRPDTPQCLPKACKVPGGEWAEPSSTLQARLLPAGDPLPLLPPGLLGRPPASMQGGPLYAAPAARRGLQG